jgi:hypothetical protein
MLYSSDGYAAAAWQLINLWGLHGLLRIGGGSACRMYRSRNFRDEDMYKRQMHM